MVPRTHGPRQISKCAMEYAYHGATLIKFTQSRPERQPLAGGYRFLNSILDRLESLPAVQTFLMTAAAQRTRRLAGASHRRNRGRVEEAAAARGAQGRGRLDRH